MLKPDEQPFVKDAIATRLAIIGVRPFVTSVLAPNDVEFLKQLPSDFVTTDAQAASLLGYCLDSDWVSRPSLLERVLAALITAGIEVAALTPIRTRVASGVNPNPDPAKALWLDAEMPFFGRDSLRPLITSLLSGYATPILQIVGPQVDGEECGKTYSRWLLEYACNLRQDVNPIFVGLAKGLGPSYPVESLAEALVAPTGRDITLRPPRTQSDYPTALGKWVLNAAMLTPGKWIYILDGFSQKDLQAETRALVDALALDISGGVYRRRLRLVLIDYPDAPSQVQQAHILQDVVPAAKAVAEDEIKACLRAHYADLARRGGGAAPDDASLRVVAEGLLGTAPPGPAKRLKQLNITLSKLRQEDLRLLGRS
jgi:hypothetical protein